MLMQATWEQWDVDMRAPSAMPALCSSFCSASQSSGSFFVIPPRHDSPLIPKLMCLRSYWVLVCLRQMVGWNQASPHLGEEKGAHLDAWLHQTQITPPLPCSHEVLLPVVEGTNLIPQHYLQTPTTPLIRSLVVLEHLTLSYYFLLRTWYAFKWPTDINVRERSVTHPKAQSCEFLLHYQAQKRALWLSNCCLSPWWDQNPGIS